MDQLCGVERSTKAHGQKSAQRGTIIVFYNVMSCSLVDVYRLSEEPVDSFFRVE